MASETIDSRLFEPAGAEARPELLVSAVLHLMSHYTAHKEEAAPCTRLASIIERHLKALADLPELAPVLRATCRQLSEQWSMVVERAMQPAQRQNRLLQLWTGTRTN